MYVQVKHALARTGANVQHGAVPILDAALSRNFGRDHMTVANQLGVFSGRFFQSPNMLLGNYQDVRGSLRADVVKRISAIVFVDLLGRSVALDYAAEETTPRNRTKASSKLSRWPGTRSSSTARKASQRATPYLKI